MVIRRGWAGRPSSLGEAGDPIVVLSGWAGTKVIVKLDRHTFRGGALRSPRLCPDVRTLLREFTDRAPQ